MCPHKGSLFCFWACHKPSWSLGCLARDWNPVTFCLLPLTPGHPGLTRAKPQLVKPPSDHRLCANLTGREVFLKRMDLAKTLQCVSSVPHRENRGDSSCVREPKTTRRHSCSQGQAPAVQRVYLKPLSAFPGQHRDEGKLPPGSLALTHPHLARFEHWKSMFMPFPSWICSQQPWYTSFCRLYPLILAAKFVSQFPLMLAEAEMS